MTKIIGFKSSDVVIKQDVYMLPCDFQHGLCVGATGSGKTSSLILPIVEDRINKGHSILIYAYKGHEHKKIKYLADKAGKLNYVVEIGKPHGRYINLLAEMELDVIDKMFKNLLGTMQNDYWTLSASRLGVNIVDVLKKIYKLETILGSSFLSIHYDTPEKRGSIEVVKYKYSSGNPSFKTLYEITKSPDNLVKFLDGLDALKEKINETIYLEKDTNKIQKALLALIRFEGSIEVIKEFNIETKSTSNSGNNGVLETFNNAISPLSKKDFINEDDLNLIDAINKSAIIIIDIESIGSDIHGVFLESILGKISQRIRKSSDLKPLTVVIDEANRILEESVDIHSDTLREAKCELLLAYQNDEQMIEKYGELKWQSIKNNFKHIFNIDTDHNITYNGTNKSISKPLIIGKKYLQDAEIKFNSISTIKNIINNRFIYDGKLFENFLIEYDIKRFENDYTLTLLSKNKQKMEIEYVGKNKKIEVEKRLETIQLKSSEEFWSQL
jgi:hypothetical protein